ncbi:MAG TPA: hypothetical protein VHK01_21170, partial [Lacipirellulaceae bacterium]|nr:hypothetical protein [Lacipirellulaceae bacterium]
MMRPAIAPAHHAVAKNNTTVAASDHRLLCIPIKPAAATATRKIGTIELSQKRLLSTGNPFGLNHQYPAAA